MSTYELVRYQRICPQGRKAHGKVTQLELREAGGTVVRKWFKCPICTPKDLIIPRTARQAYEIWSQHGKTNVFRDVPRKVLSKFTPEEAVV